MTEAVCEDGKGPAPHALSTRVNAFCRCRCPNPLDLLFPQLTRSPAAARAEGRRMGPGAHGGSFVTRISDPKRRQNIKTRRFYLKLHREGCATHQQPSAWMHHAAPASRDGSALKTTPC